jgi:hypothetical protein
LPNYGTTTIHALRKLLGTSQASDLDAGFAALADDIDAVMVAHASGIFVSRGSAGSRGEGFIYLSTDVPQIDISDGTNWRPVWPIADLSVTTAKLAANAVTAAKIELQSAWTEIALQPASGTWLGFPRGLNWYKDSLGNVHFRGDATVSSASIAPGVTLLTMPVGARPGVNIRIEAITDGGGIGVASLSATTGVLATVNTWSANTWNFGLNHYRAEN